MRWGTWIKITVGWLAVGLVMGACGGKDRAAEQTGQVPAVSAPSEAPAVAEPATVDLDGDFWFAGFHVTLNGAAFDPASSSVTVEATFENLGAEPAVFDGTTSLASDGSFYEASATQSLPTVPGLSTGTGELVFDVDDAFTFEGAVLTIGLADNNQAVVPFDGTSEQVSLEPTTYEVGGSASAGAHRGGPPRRRAAGRRPGRARSDRIGL